MTLSPTENSLGERREELPSVVGSKTGSEVGEVKIAGEDDGRGGRFTDEAIEREIGVAG